MIVNRNLGVTEMIKTFEELECWKKAASLRREIGELVKQFPSEEKYGLISQLRRCALSVPTNISEGSGRNIDKDFAQFLNISPGSAYELEILLILSHDVNFITTDQLEELTVKISEIQKMTFGLIKTLRQESYV